MCDRQYTTSNPIATEFPLAKPTIASDKLLKQIYIGRRFKNEIDRLEKLFELYTKMTTQPPPSKNSAKRKTKP
jgi:hypothetical protein